MVARRVRLTASLFLLAVVGLGLVAGPGVSVATPDTGPVSTSGTAGLRSADVDGVQPTPETDNTITRILLHANGSATWVLEIRTRLETDRQVEEYRAFQREFRDNTSRYFDPYRSSIVNVVAAARNATGREMTATRFRASTSIQSMPRRWGVVTYRFLWTNFAETSDGRLVVGDVFQGGLLITEDDSLEVMAPPDYHVVSADPSPDERDENRLSWVGREHFSDGQPEIVVAKAASRGGDGDLVGTLPVSSPVFGGATVLGAAALLLVGYQVWVRRPGAGTTGTDESATAGDDDLLTDEDRVRQLLADHGGRMRQREIAEGLEWSKSKTSRVLSRMESKEAITKLQLGRENVIDLSGREGEDTE